MLFYPWLNTECKPDLCDYFVNAHGHHFIRGIRDASSTMSWRLSLTIRPFLGIRDSNLIVYGNRAFNRDNRALIFEYKDKID